MNKNPKKAMERNNSLFDKWSVVHIFTCIALTLILGPATALIITWLWEPLEVLIISPILGKFGILFGHESLGNVISDLIVDVVGVGIGVLILQII